LTGEAGNASRRKVIVEATARSLEWASAWRTQDESGPTFSRVIRTNFGDRMAKIFRENSDSLATILNTLLGDENAMTEALKHRDQLLNSQVPGLSSQQANLSDPYDGQQEMLKMAKEYEKNPTDKKRKQLISLANEVAEARFKN
jgi:hypothetical protein